MARTRLIDKKPPTKLKRTFYLHHSAVVTLSEIQINEFKRTGKKPDLSALVDRAIHLLDKRGL